MISAILFALWFFLPAGLANSAPVFANKIPLLSKLGMPLDGGKTYRGKRIFGDHKTVRGLLAGTLVGFIVGLLQILAFQTSSFIRDVMSPLDYTSWEFIFIGAFMGAGALLGDAIKSFFKRQANVPSGKSWFPFDQIDYIIGGLVASLPFVQLELTQYFVIGIVWFLIHPVATFVGWLLKLKDSPI